VNASVAEALPAIEDQNEFNRQRWDELCADPFLASLDYRFETDHLGHIIMIPPAGFDHSDAQGDVGRLLDRFLPATGKSRPECPISTRGGTKVADVVWISDERLQRARKGSLLVIAPEICVEILSPSNTRQEIEEKKRLYFGAGADEFWICGLDGRMEFYRAGNPVQPAQTSELCPEFPQSIG
jgi:Uma2 family endonuclease